MIKLLDINFSHTKYRNYNVCRPNSYFEWDRDTSNVKPDDILFMTDHSMFQAASYNCRKVAWIIEPCEKNSAIHNWIIDNCGLFEIVLTYEKNLLDVGKNFTYYVAGCCWIEEKDTRIWDKTKLISTIMSNKQQTEHQRFRHVLKNGHLNDVDVYGAGGNIKVAQDSGKIESLKNHMFHIVVDQSMVEHGFTEKAIDCFATGTIPIYRGVESIKKYFNVDGMLFFKTPQELDEVKKLCTESYYRSKMASIVDNFNRSKDFFVCEDWLYKNLKLPGFNV